MTPAGILTTVLLVLGLQMPQNLPTDTTPLRNTFVTAAETVIDNASAVDLHADNTHFSAQMEQLRSAKANLARMAEDEREREAASAADDLIFAVAACHLQAKDGADTARCQGQVDAARMRAMEALRKHKVNGVWVDGPPASRGGRQGAS